MTDSNAEVFIGLFKDAYRKCFGFSLLNPLSETESKHFANKIFEDTGLVIGAKSIKNYSSYILQNAEAKPENPSVATLDTFARYVLNAPYTDEVKRKEKEGYYPYWYQYKSKFIVSSTEQDSGDVVVTDKKEVQRQKIKNRVILLVVGAFILGSFLWIYFGKKNLEQFAENFHSVNEDSLQRNGWVLQAKDEVWWNRRGERPDHLSLFTLRGDNWADSANVPSIKNLLLRKISSACFTTEIHFDDFIPKHNWQQAGILLLEDTVVGGKSIRLSIAYNDFFGGFKKPGEILIQGISSNSSDFSKPEEIIHLPIYSMDAGQENLITGNLRKSALKIEKHGNYFRFLYAAGPMENSAFKEILQRDILIQPKWVGIFALQGFVNDSSHIPAQIHFFSFADMPCE